MKVYLKLTFHLINCAKTCQHEQVNKFVQHLYYANCRVNNFEQFYIVILRAGGKLENERVGNPFVLIVPLITRR